MAGALLLTAVICGFISGYVAQGKGLSFGGFFVVGFLLLAIGIVIAIVAQGPVNVRRDSFVAEGPRPGVLRRQYFDGRSWTDRPS